MANQKGWVSLWRQSINSQVFKNDGLWKLWTWCLMRANHEPNIVDFKTGRGTSEVKVLPGQFLFGRHSAARDLSANASTVWKRMLKLQTLQNLTIESNTHYSLITIVNWNTYQKQKKKSNSESDRQVTAKCQPSNTDNNDNNENKDIAPPKKKKFIPPTLEDVKEYFDEKGYTETSAVRAWNYYDVGDWKDSQGKQVKSWKQKMQGVWFKEENKKQTQQPTRHTATPEEIENALR